MEIGKISIQINHFYSCLSFYFFLSNLNSVDCSLCLFCLPQTSFIYFIPFIICCGWGVTIWAKNDIKSNRVGQTGGGWSGDIEIERQTEKRGSRNDKHKKNVLFVLFHETRCS